MGRAARNSNGTVLLYADSVSPAMQAAIQQTLERRNRQIKYNLKHGIVPQTIQKALPEMNSKDESFISGTTTDGTGAKRLVAKKEVGRMVTGLLN